MRRLQIAVFALGVLSFLASAAFVGGETGDVLWRTGMAAMFTDMVLMGLWPAAKS